MNRVIAYLVLLILTVSAQDNLPVLGEVDVVELIKSCDYPRYLIGESDDYISAAMSKNTEAILEEIFCVAILTLWDLGDVDKLELLWWETTNPIKRVLVLSCFYGLGGGEDKQLTTWPKFNYNKFNRNEKQLRLRELQYVKENRDDLKNAINAFIKKRGK